MVDFYHFTNSNRKLKWVACYWIITSVYFYLGRVTILVAFLLWFLFCSDNEMNVSNKITSPLLTISALYFLGCQRNSSWLLPSVDYSVYLNKWKEQKSICSQILITCALSYTDDSKQKLLKMFIFSS